MIKNNMESNNNNNNNNNKSNNNNNLNDLLDPYNWEYDYGTNTVKKTNKWKH